jgi:hypothetical protein
MKVTLYALGGFMGPQHPGARGCVAYSLDDRILFSPGGDGGWYIYVDPPGTTSAIRGIRSVFLKAPSSANPLR